MKRAEVIEKQELRDRVHVYPDRWEAGEVLGHMLEMKYADRDDVSIFAVPAGGVPVGLKVQERLEAPLDLIIARKLKIPGNPEAGFGAMAHGGSLFLNKPLVEELGLEERDINAEAQKVEKELEKRNQLFRQGRSLPDPAGRVAVLVDDGLASGYTMFSALRMLRDRGAVTSVVAVPTAPQRTIDHLSTEADEIYCPNVRTGNFFAVADAYEHWYDLYEEDVIGLMKEFSYLP